MPHRFSFLRRSLCTFLCAAIAVMSFPSVVRAEDPPPTVVIGEIAWAGSSVSLADEWIELWNLGDADIPLAGWSLAGAGDGGKVIFFPPDAVLPARNAFLIANYPAGDPKTVIAVTPDMATTTLALSNSTLAIELRDADETVVDRAGDGGTPAAGATTPVKTSMIRLDPMMDGNDENAWVTATTSEGLLEEVPDMGTPGLCDGCSGSTSLPETPSEEMPPINTTATSTADAPESANPETTSSTEATEDAGMAAPPTDEAVAATTTTEATAGSTAEGETNTTTTTETSASPIEPEETETTPPMSEPEIADPPKPAYAMLRLNEIAPNPETGKEWVEILSLERTNPIPLEGCELHDATGRILTLRDVTIDPATSSRVVIELATAKLNNGGDAVALYDPDGKLLDAMTYVGTPKGTTWIRYPEPDGTWQGTIQPTPGAANVLSTSPAEPPAQRTESKTEPDPPPAPTTPAAEAAFTTTTSKTAPKKPSLPSVPSASTAAPTEKKTKDTPSKTKQRSASQPKAQTKPSAKKPAAPKTFSPPPIPISIDMATSDEFTGARVLLRGTAGSPPALLTNHAFVLHAPDGRGLRVSVPTSRKLPAYGSEIEITGTLRFDDRGIPTLKLASKDGWRTHGTSTQRIEPRPVDLALPSTEDAWSLVRVTGTVKTVKNQTIALDLEDAGIAVVIRNVVKYRTKRLVAGDVVDVTGVFDMTGAEPRLLPRAADDILLVRHAEPKTALNAKSGNGTTLPGWTPFGAAAGAVAFTEGVKHARQRMRRKALEHKLAEMTDGP